MYGVLLCDAGIVALASQADQPRLHPADLLLLATFLRANDSLRQVDYNCRQRSSDMHVEVSFLGC